MESLENEQFIGNSKAKPTRMGSHRSFKNLTHNLSHENINSRRDKTQHGNRHKPNDFIANKTIEDENIHGFFLYIDRSWIV